MVFHMTSIEKLGSGVLMYKAHVFWKGNVASEVSIRKFTLHLDTNTDGWDTGPNPTETLLAALGGCMIVNYGRLSRKMNLKIDEIRIDIVAERPKLNPKVTKINYTIKIKSNEDPKKLNHLRRLAEKNGTVFNTVRKGTVVEGNLEIIKETKS